MIIILLLVYKTHSIKNTVYFTATVSHSLRSPNLGSVESQGHGRGTNAAEALTTFWEYHGLNCIGIYLE